MIGLKTDMVYECWFIITITFWNVKLIEGSVSTYSNAWVCRLQEK